MGLVRAAMRPEQSVELYSLSTAAGAEVDMSSILIIGNSNSFEHMGAMVTPRGYLAKYGNGKLTEVDNG